MDDLSRIFDKVNARRDARSSRTDVVRELLDAQYHGMHLVAPQRLSLSTDDSFPIVAFRGFRGGETKELDSAAVVVVTRLESNEVFAERVFDEKELDPNAVSVAEPPDDPEDVMCRQFAFDVRKRVPSLPWRMGTYRVAVLLQQTCSDVATVPLLPDGLADDAEARAAMDAARRPGYPRPRWPPHAVGRPDDKTPPTPRAPGIALATDPPFVIVDAGGPRSKCVLRGSFALRALRREIVRPLAAEDAPYQGEGSPLRWYDVGDPDIAAVVPIHLVLCGREMLGPFVMRLDVPSYTRVPPGQPSPVVEGAFAVDLLSLPGMPRIMQRYDVWAFSGEAVSAHASLVLASASALPPLGEG